MNELRIVIPSWVNVAAYLGDWAMEPSRGAALFNFAGSLDFSRHERPQLKPVAARVRSGQTEHAWEEMALAISEWMEGETSLAAAEKVNGPNGQDIAVIKLTGLMMKGQTSLNGTSTIQVRRELRAAATDPSVGGILLVIDSPGGTVSGTPDLARDIKAAGRTKPLFAHIEDLAGSASYWAASQADKITANNNPALVGSIGTLQVMQDHSVAADKAGVRTLVFRTGPLKGMGTLGAPVTEEQAAHANGLVHSVQQSFDQAVSSGRGFNKTQLAAVKHGGVLTAGDGVHPTTGEPTPGALSIGLIDAIQPMERTLAQLSEAIRKGEKPSRRGMAAEEKQPAADPPRGLLPVARLVLPVRV